MKKVAYINQKINSFNSKICVPGDKSLSIRQIGSTDTKSMSLDEGIEFIYNQNKV